MKRISALLLIIALLCCFSAPAETAASFEETAKSAVSVINQFIGEFYGMNQLFTSIQEVAPGEIYGFASDEEDIQMLVMANTQTGAIDCCTIITGTPENLRLGMNCTCLLPSIEYVIGNGDASASVWVEDMMAVAEWFDALYDDAFAAFEGGEMYTASYTDNPNCKVDLMIVPLEGSSTMMINYYFHNDT